MGISRAVWFGLLLCACNPTPASKANSTVVTCASAGPTCIFAPGKLGRCVERSEPCEGVGCFVCQSQH